MIIASICIHKDEEPPISGPDGICNIFFGGCNLHCIYCQNHEISRPEHGHRFRDISIKETIDQIEYTLSTGIKAVGFVSPSHVVPQVKAIIRGLNGRGLKPITVYNTNSYDKQEVIDSLEGLINVYLPDSLFLEAVLVLLSLLLLLAFELTLVADCLDVVLAVSALLTGSDLDTVAGDLRAVAIL